MITFFTFLALVGLGVSITLNESCTSLPIEDKCTGPLIEFLKFISSLTTLLTIGFMLWQLRVTGHRNATKASLAIRHVYRQKRDTPSTRPDDSRTTALRGAAAFLGSACPGLRGVARLLYLAANCVHTVPTLSLTVDMQMLGMMVTYRIESLIAVRASALRSTPEVPPGSASSRVVSPLLFRPRSSGLHTPLLRARARASQRFDFNIPTANHSPRPRLLCPPPGLHACAAAARREAQKVPGTSTRAGSPGVSKRGRSTQCKFARGSARGSQSQGDTQTDTTRLVSSRPQLFI